MSTNKIVNDPRYAVGSSSDVNIASSPASLYFENSFTSLPPACIPATGAIQRTDIYNTASVRGLSTNYDMIFDIKNNHASNTMLITHITKCFQWIRLYLDDVSVAWLDDFDVAYFCTTRNLVLTTNSESDYENKWGCQGYDSNQYLNGFRAPFNILLNPGQGGRVTVPLDYIFSNVLHKFDSALVQKISVEVKWRPNTGNPVDTCSFIVNADANANIYPDLGITNSLIENRQQLYTDATMFKPLSSMYVKPMIKMERQQFTLTREVDGATVAAPASAILKLENNFAYHKRILGLCLTLVPKYTAFGGAGVTPGQCWQPNSCRCIIRKGGKELERMDDTHKFSRQANRFLENLGSQWQPRSEYAVDPADLSNQLVLFTGNTSNFVSFLDRNLAEGHTDEGYLQKVQLIGGISNDQSEAWSVELQFTEAAVVASGIDGLVPFGNQLVATRTSPDTVAHWLNSETRGLAEYA